jgi:tight adherence protein B
MNQTIILVVAAVLILALILIVAAISLRRRGKKNLKERLDTFTNPEVASAEAAAATAEDSGQRSIVAERIDKALEGRGFAQNIQRNLARADLKLTVGEFLGAKVFSMGAAFGLGTYLGRGFGPFSMLVGLLVGVVGLYIPDFFVKRRANKRIKNFNDQLGDTISLMSNSLRSGYSLLQSMELISREAPSPISDEFKRVTREVGLGIATRDALNNMLRRVPSDDLDLLITAIGIQMEVGGNLSQILDNIGHTIRERVRIKGEIKVLTAQQQYAGYIISGMPIALALVLFGISPDYMSRMFVMPWICMPICGLILIIAGFFAIMKIVAIDI